MFEIGKIYTVSLPIWFGHGKRDLPESIGNDIRISPGDNILYIKTEEYQADIYMIWYYFLFDNKIIYRPEVNTSKEWFVEVI